MTLSTIKTWLTAHPFALCALLCAFLLLAAACGEDTASDDLLSQGVLRLD
jgi:hypothetical protein